MKKCSRCNKTKKTTCFYSNRSKKDGYSSYCKLCEKEIYTSRKDKISLQKKKYYRALSKVVKVIPGVKTCFSCKKDKNSDCFYTAKSTIDGLRSICILCIKSKRKNNADKINHQKRIWRENNKARANEVARRSYKKCKTPEVSLKHAVSKAVRCGLKRNHGSKHGESTFKHLPYSAEVLKIHLENNFEDWMSWDNYGKYDSSKRTWQIDHIIPQSKLPYKSLDDDNFKKCWALDNLRPLEAISNIKKGNRVQGN